MFKKKVETYGDYRRRTTVQGREIPSTPQEDLDDAVKGLRAGLRERYSAETSRGALGGTVTHRMHLGELLDIERDYVSAVWYLRRLEMNRVRTQRAKNVKRYRPTMVVTDADRMEMQNKQCKAWWDRRFGVVNAGRGIG